MTMSLFLGNVTSTFLRLCCEAPFITIFSSLIILSITLLILSTEQLGHAAYINAICAVKCGVADDVPEYKSNFSPLIGAQVPVAGAEKLIFLP